MANGAKHPTTVSYVHERRRIASLDGVRALALIAVLAYHAAPGTIHGGFLGVDVFFVLSGFLLSSLLLEEHRRTGAIDYVRYATRRVCRIAPALVVLLAAVVFVVPLVAAADAYRLRGDVVWSLAGLTNWHLIADGSSYFTKFGRPSFVRHLWSVAVEIQFYIVCPFVVAWLARKRRSVAIGLVAAGIAASATASAVFYEAADPSRAYYGTDSRVGALLVGVLLAVLLVDRAPRRERPTGRADALAGVALASLATLVVVVGENARVLYPGGFLAVEAVTAVLIALALRPGWLAELFGRDELQWLGQRSYGIYLWFWPLVVLVRPGTRANWSPLPAAVVTIGVSIVLGALSYHFVERRFLRSAPPRTAQPRRLALRLVAPVAVFLLAVVTMAQVSTTNPLSVTLRAGHKVLAAQVPPTSATTSTLPPDTVAPDTVPPATTPPATAAPAPARSEPAIVAAPRPAAPEPVATEPPAPVPHASVPVTAVGDSVMVGASQALLDRLGPNGFIDAQENRQFSQGVQIVQRMHDEGSLGRVLVIHLGNNGPVGPSDIDELIAAARDVPHVLLVTVRNNESWQDSANDALRDAARYPKVKIVDWYNASAGHGNWFQSDDTHFPADSGPGNDAYADLIAGSIPAG